MNCGSLLQAVGKVGAVDTSLNTVGCRTEDAAKEGWGSLMGTVVCCGSCVSVTKFRSSE